MSFGPEERQAASACAQVVAESSQGGVASMLRFEAEDIGRREWFHDLGACTEETVRQDGLEEAASSLPIGVP